MTLRMGAIFFTCITGIALVAACSDDDDVDTGTVTSTECLPVLGTSPSGCPEMAAAESAYESVRSTCGVTDADLDASNAASPTLTAAGKTKLCATCECRKAVFAYQTQYANCTGADEANAAFAKNLYDVAALCK